MSWEVVAALVTAITAIAVILVSWVVWVSQRLAVTLYQVRMVISEHLPHLDQKLDRLLDGQGIECRRHRRAIGRLQRQFGGQVGGPKTEPHPPEVSQDGLH